MDFNWSVNEFSSTIDPNQFGMYPLSLNGYMAMESRTMIYTPATWLSAITTSRKFIYSVIYKRDHNLMLQNCSNLKSLTRAVLNIPVDFSLSSTNKNESTKDLWFVSQILNQIVRRNMFDEVNSWTFQKYFFLPCLRLMYFSTVLT